MAAQIKKSLAPKNAAAKKVLEDQNTNISDKLAAEAAVFAHGPEKTGGAEAQKARSEDLMTVKVVAKETDQTLIVPKSVNGKERWFAKSAIKSFTKEDDGFVIQATRREFAYRGMEDMAQLVAH